MGNGLPHYTEFEIVITTAEYHVFRTICKGPPALRDFMTRAIEVLKPGETLIYRIVELPGPGSELAH